MDDLKQIRKYYGEDMTHLCRNLFPTLLEKEGLLFSLLDSKFARSKFLCKDIKETNNIEAFKNYIYSLIDVEQKEIVTLKTPYELLSEAGYNLYECKTESEIQSFRHYYYRKNKIPEYIPGKPIESNKGEELCTFNGGRLNSCYVFFAVKKNVNEIKRENFKNPFRQDEYGTSVISIQFSKDDTYTLSIKNRYNHTVNNPDATFSNDLDNIIPGLTKSFENYYGHQINSSKQVFELDGYVRANDGKFYKYNYEVDNIYYCPDNIIIDNFEVKREYANEKERYIIFDYFILDLKEKTIKLYNDKINHSFQTIFDGVEDIKINKKDNNDKEITIITSTGKSIITINKYNQMIEFYNDYLEKIGNHFVSFCSNLQKVTLLNVKEMEEWNFSCCSSLEELSLPELEKIGNYFAPSCPNLKRVYMPNAKCVGNSCFYNCSSLEKLSLPQLEEAGTDFSHNCTKLSKVNLPNLKRTRDWSFAKCLSLEELSLPKLEEVSSDFAYCCEKLSKVNLENVKRVENYSFDDCISLKEIILSNAFDCSYISNERFIKRFSSEIVWKGDERIDETANSGYRKI